MIWPHPLKKCAAPRPLVGLADSTVTELEARLLAEGGTLNKTVSDLTGTVADLTAELAKLRARLGQDSSNSSRPSSTNAPWKPKRKPPQGPAGRKPGGQPGHPPHTRKITNTGTPWIFSRCANASLCSTSTVNTRALPFQACATWRGAVRQACRWPLPRRRRPPRGLKHPATRRGRRRRRAGGRRAGGRPPNAAKYRGIGQSYAPMRGVGGHWPCGPVRATIAAAQASRVRGTGRRREGKRSAT